MRLTDEKRKNEMEVVWMLKKLFRFFEMERKIKKWLRRNSMVLFFASFVILFLAMLILSRFI
jgi:hypothetical protein